jgi:hypothetical protein
MRLSCKPSLTPRSTRTRTGVEIVTNHPQLLAGRVTGHAPTALGNQDPAINLPEIPATNLREQNSVWSD